MAITIDGTDGISPLKSSGQTQTTTGTAAAPAISSSSDTDSGLFFGTNEVKISTGGTQRATVDSSGRLLVGTSSAINTDNSPSLEIVNIGTAVLSLGRDDSTISANNVLGSVKFFGNDGGSYQQCAEIAAAADGTHANNDKPTRLVFSTTADGASSPTERLRIDSSGNVGIGTTSPSGLLHISGDTCQMHFTDEDDSSSSRIYQSGATFAIDVDQANAKGGSVLAFRVDDSEHARILEDGRFLVGTTTALSDGLICFKGTFASNRGLVLESTQSSGEMIRFNTSSGNAGKIDSNGTSTSYSTSSDYRLKENIVDLDGAIDRVKQLAPKRFNFICDANTTVDGFIAHEAQAVVPEAITGTHNGVEVWREGEELPDGVSVGDNKLDEDGNTIPDYQGIDQSKLVPLLTAALQEAIGKIETLETQNADLLARVTALEAAE